MRLLSMNFALTLMVLLVGNPSVPCAFAQNKADDVAGEWLYEGKMDQPCAIFRHGSVLLLVNQGGHLATGRMEGKGKVLVISGNGWQKGLRGEVRDGGKSLTWRNGTVWKRR